MINHIFFEGIVVNTWKFGSDLFARLASYRDPGQPLKRISETRDEPDYVNVRFTNAVPQGVLFEKGNLLRVEGLLQSREYQENLSEFILKAQKNSSGIPAISLNVEEQRQVHCGRSTLEILVDKFVLLPAKPARQRSASLPIQKEMEVLSPPIGEVSL